MVNYNNSKIYVIKSNETEDVYVGSTCETLKSRFVKHKSCFKNSKTRNTQSKIILKYSDAIKSYKVMSSKPDKVKISRKAKVKPVKKRN